MSRLPRAALFLAAALAAAPGCGDDTSTNKAGTTSSSTTTTGSTTSTGSAGGGGEGGGAGGAGGAGGSAPACGDGVCDASETCQGCSADCGACPPACGDGACNGAETCADCPGDCGACPACGDGSCNGAETCVDCPGDCGACPPICGDGSCQLGEQCDVCEADCGICPPVCGDGVCEPVESCQACQVDCGACPPGACTHDVCVMGAPLVNGCDPCVTLVCIADPQCCTTSWDSQCLIDVELECGNSCGCSHSVCEAGAALVDGCSQCASTVCANDSACCDPNFGWDALCVDEASFLCGASCP